MGVKFVVVLLGLGACFPKPQPPRRPLDVLAPKVLHARPLEIGQWARYDEKTQAGKIGELWLAAVGRDDCGTWVRARLIGGGSDHEWLVCVDEDQAGYRITRALVDPGDGNPHTIDPANPGAYAGELAALRSRVVPPALTGTFTRENVAVAAGRFSGALVVSDGRLRTWLHTFVPFGGVVKITDDHGRTDELVAAGDNNDGVESRFRTAARSQGAHPRGRHWWEIGGTFAWANGVEGEPAAHGMGFAATLGLGVTRTVDAVLHSDLIAGGATDLVSAGGGVRWSPFATRRGLDFYVQSTVGYAEAQTVMDDATTRGVDLSNEVGYLLRDGRHDWSLGVHIEHQIAYFIGARTWTQAVVGGFGVQLEW